MPTVKLPDGSKGWVYPRPKDKDISCPETGLVVADYRTKSDWVILGFDKSYRASEVLKDGSLGPAMSREFSKAQIEAARERGPLPVRSYWVGEAKADGPRAE
jgi:hypothetical protein